MSTVKALSKPYLPEETSEGEVLIDFYADWCGPCQMMMPRIEQMASDPENTIKICKVNIDTNPDLAGEFGVKTIPTFIALKDGNVINQKIGMGTREDLVNLFK